MFESAVARLLTSGAFLVIFAFLEHELKLGIIASGLLTFLLVRKQCQRWLSLALFLAELGLLYYAEMKYASFLPFMLLELVCLLCNPVGDVSKIKGWRPYEREIRQFLIKNDPSVLHRVDDALDEYANKEKELYTLLLKSYAKKAADAASSSSRPKTNRSPRTDDVVRQIRVLVDRHAPGIARHVEQMLRENEGKEEDLLHRLRAEFDVGEDDPHGSYDGHNGHNGHNGYNGQNGYGGYGDQQRGPGAGAQTPLSVNKTSHSNSMSNSGSASTFGSGNKKWTHRDSEIIENAKWEAQQRIQQRMRESVAALRR
jgi:hypothetical protein